MNNTQKLEAIVRHLEETGQEVVPGQKELLRQLSVGAVTYDCAIYHQHTIEELDNDYNERNHATMSGLHESDYDVTIVMHDSSRKLPLTRMTYEALRDMVEVEHGYQLIKEENMLKGIVQQW